ncbi:3'-5' exonuclease [Brachybacterium sp. GPGPB12]|uniref:3'-5' exonuclease n=2 Tax=Brachybacterium sp. GPGPB12 TaxID=3023517 RepID=UPI0031344BAE
MRARRQIPALVAGLEERGLPAQVVGLGGSLHRPEVADVRALLECAHDPGRGDALMRLLTGPRIRLGARDLAVLGRWRDRMGSRRRAGAGEAGAVGARDEAEEVSLVDAVDDLPPADWTDPSDRSLTPVGRERSLHLQQMLREMRRLLPAPLPDLVTAAIRVLEVDLAPLETAPGTGALADLEAFRDHAASFERTARRGGLGAYLDLLEISEDEEAGLSVTAAPEQAHDPAAVTIVTMHSAKGLEWDLVAVAGLTEGSVPSYDLRRAKADETGRVRVPGDGWLGKLSGASVPTAARGDADTLPELAWAEADTQVDAEGIIQEYRFAQGEEALAEDRRLMYVAVTRAKRRLLLTSAAWREGCAPRGPAPAISPRRRRCCPRRSAPRRRCRRRTRWSPSGPPPPGRPPRARPSRPAPAPPPASRRSRRSDQFRNPTRQSPRRPQGSRRPRSPTRSSRSSCDAPRRPRPARRRARRALPTAAFCFPGGGAGPRPAGRRDRVAAPGAAPALAGRRARHRLPRLARDPVRERDPAGPRGPRRSRGSGGGARPRRRPRPARSLRGLRLGAPRPLAVERPVTTRIGEIGVRGVIDAVFADPEGGDGTAGPDGTGGVIIVDWKTGRMPRPSQRANARCGSRSTAWPGTSGPVCRFRTSARPSTSWPTGSPTRSPSTPPANGSRRCCRGSDADRRLSPPRAHAGRGLPG